MQQAFFRGVFCGLIGIPLMLMLGFTYGTDEPMMPADMDIVADEPAVSFVPVDIYIDPIGYPLAAYQFELRALGGEVGIVGVEGGEHSAYELPPFYDPAALMQDRIIIAGYSLQDDLPTGHTRIATVHIQVTGPMPELEILPVVAADLNGQNIDAQFSFE
jgi:hypothetical protein